MRIALVFAAAFVLAAAMSPSSNLQVTPRHATQNTHTYVGFDRNDYPGDDALPVLRKTFSFSGYWLNAPPGETANSWKGKREILRQHGFGFLVLFNGRLDKQLKAARDPKLMGNRDANAAINAARIEGFPRGTLIFVDQEEGGRMLPEQREYLYAWIDGVNASGYRAGVYCSGIPDNSGGGVITPDDIRANAGVRKISFFVYNDACPPSSGCVFSAPQLTISQNGVRSAAIWQIAQSPRRKNLTARCRTTYAPDGNCYPPGLAARGIFVDVDVANSADPSESSHY